jgi:tetratricopeptide (TPR) repeat protein
MSMAVTELLPVSAPAPLPAGETQTRFVGRTRELALLERHLTGAGSPVLLLAGEPGIGKTRLVQEVARQAVAHGMTVLTGGCQRRGNQEPYAPLLEALEQCIRARTPLHLHADLEGCAWLVRLLPELAESSIPPLPPATLAMEQERRLMFAAVGRFLANVAGRRGILLLLDDLQWAGTDALDLLATLVRSAAAIPLRVIGVFRDTEVDQAHPLQVLLADLAHRGLAAYHRLDPLGPDEAAHLLGDLLRDGAMGSGARERVLQRAGGIPFFLVSFVQSVRQGAVSIDTLPWDIGQSLRQRVAALPPEAREILSVAAVIGRTIPSWLVMAVAELSEVRTLAAFDVACGAGLLEEAGEDYRFAHDVIREALEADLGPARRIILHRRIAEALEGHQVAAAVAVLAYHYARSGLHEKAMHYLEQAGDQAAAVFANEVALSHYTEARDRLQRIGADPIAPARLDAKRGAVLYTLARHDEALEALETATRWYRAAGNLEEEGQVAARIATVHFYRGTLEAGRARTLPILEELERKGPSRALATLYAAHVRLLVLSSNPSLTLIERAGELARALGDDGLLAGAEVVRGLVLLSQGHIEDARGVLEQIIPLAEALSDYATVNLAMDALSESLKLLGEFEAGRAYRERVLERAEQVGDPSQLLVIRARLGEACFLLGDWQQARVYLERALEISHSLDSNLGTDFAHLSLAEFNLAAGNLDEASRYLEVCLAGAQRVGHEVTVRNAQRLLAVRDLHAGHPDEAVRRLDLVAPTEGAAQADTLLLRAWAHLEIGNDAQADETIRKAIGMAREGHDRLNLCEALLVQGRVQAWQGRQRAAHDTFDEAWALAAAMPYPYAEARILFQRGAMHLKQGEPEPARETLEAAQAIFRRLGARKDTERTEQLLATLG